MTYSYYLHILWHCNICN